MKSTVWPDGVAEYRMLHNLPCNRMSGTRGVRGGNGVYDARPGQREAFNKGWLLPYN